MNPWGSNPSARRRDKLYIIAEILEIAKEGTLKTQIMYRANLSWNALQLQLKSFLEGELLEVEEYGTRRRYRITPKGAEMVRSYQKVCDGILG